MKFICFLLASSISYAADNQVTIDQIGSSNKIKIEQIAPGTNSIDLTVTISDSNNIDLEQHSTLLTNKSILATITDNNNTLTVNQNDEGNHYATVNLSGGNKTVNITQEGTGNHSASVTLLGQPAGLNLIQSGSTNQTYSLTSTCANSNGCAPISVQQGQ